jgi:hypothetical protein
MSNDFPVENFVFGFCSAADVVNDEIAFGAFVVKV